MQRNLVIIVLIGAGILAVPLVLVLWVFHAIFVFSYLRIRRFAAKRGKHLPGSYEVVHRDQRVKFVLILLYAPYSPYARIRRFGEMVRHCAPYFFLLSGCTYSLIAFIMSVGFCLGLERILEESGGSRMLIFFLCGGILLSFLTAWVWICMRFVVSVRRFLNIIKRCEKNKINKALCRKVQR